MSRVSVLVVFLLSACSLSAASWSPDDFPNPKKDVSICGRGVASNICDPDNLLTKSEADRVEGVIKDIHEGVDPYVRRKCGDALEGYMVAVAVMRNMSVPPGSTASAAAQAFARRIHDDWGVGSAACNNGVVLLVAQEQRQVYISTGKGAKTALPDSHVKSIIGAARPILRKGLVGEGIFRMTVDIGLGLAGSPPPSADDEGLDWVGLGIFGVFAGFLGHGVWRRIQRRRGYSDCKRRLEKIKKEQDKLRNREWSRPESCPICLEDFDAQPGGGGGNREPAADNDGPQPSAPLLPTDPEEPASVLRQRAPATASSGKEGEGGGRNSNRPHRKPITLPCGHTFCESCLDQWVEGHTNCPICRRDLSGEPAAPPSGKQETATSTATADRQRQQEREELVNADLLFRLHMLQRMYPWYLTDSMIWQWTREAQERGTFDWAGTREFELQDPAAAAQHEAQGSTGFSASFGGGSSLGGGGGGGSW